MRRTTTLTAATLLGLVLLAPTSAATAAAETCHGEAATLVGTTPTLTGTEGRDVIVTGTATTISALGGDDLVCVTAGGNINRVSVDVGAGNDVVDTSTAPEAFGIDVALGAGTDTLAGGQASERVLTGPAATGGVDYDADFARTLGGSDEVTTGSIGVRNVDDVELGDGDDRMVLVGSAAGPGVLLFGGQGTDTVVADVRGTRHEAVVDLTAGRVAATPGSPDAPSGDSPIASFEAAEVTVSSQWLYYTGIEGDDTLVVHGEAPLGCCIGPGLDVESLGGDDRVLLDSPAFDPGGRINLGAGQDLLVAAHRSSPLTLDLKSGGFWNNQFRSSVSSVENAFLMAPEVTMLGDNADNELYVAGCDSRLRGGHGDDVLRVLRGDPFFHTYTFECRGSSTMSGGPGQDVMVGGEGRDRLSGDGDADRIVARGGNDRIRGGAGGDVMDGGDGRDDVRGQQGNDIVRGNADADTLLGGTGRDYADGAQGRDRCAAEREIRCER